MAANAKEHGWPFRGIPKPSPFALQSAAIQDARSFECQTAG